MTIRRLAQSRFGGALATGMRDLNARHPWSHNDAFHAWVTTRLPDRRHHALDFGCGRGELVAALAGHFESVRGVDVDAPMRRAATARCAGLPNVTIDATDLSDVEAGIDLVTMVAVLHHLEVSTTFAAGAAHPAPRRPPPVRRARAATVGR